MAKPDVQGTSASPDSSDSRARRPVWVVPDEVPAIVPKSARHTEPHWIRVYRSAAIGGDLLAAVIGTSVALLTRLAVRSAVT